MYRYIRIHTCMNIIDNTYEHVSLKNFISYATEDFLRCLVIKAVPEFWATLSENMVSPIKLKPGS